MVQHVGHDIRSRDSLGIHINADLSPREIQNFIKRRNWWLQFLNLRERHLRHFSLPVRGPINGRVMHQDQLPVYCCPDIYLNEICTDSYCFTECGQRVFRVSQMLAPVRDDGHKAALG